MRDLVTDPSWQAHELGASLPDSPHAVSVSLPLWEHVIGYEEGDTAVTGKFRSGYPRFFLPPLLQALFAKAKQEFAQDGQAAMVLPTAAAAARCAEFTAKRRGTLGKCHPWHRGTVVLILPEEDLATARLFWRFSGETLSTRLAESILAGKFEAPDDDGSSGVIRARLAKQHGISAEDVFLYPSGMAAVFAAHRLLLSLRPGLRSIQLDFPYVDVLKVQEEFSTAPPEFLPLADESSLQRAIQQIREGQVSAVFCEMPSNPLLRCVPLSRLSPALREGGVPLIVDDTVATCINVAVLPYADIVTTSLTKSFSGKGDVLAGALTLNPASPFYHAFRNFLRSDQNTAPTLCSEDATALEANSRDFPKRVRRMSQNALALANMLRQHPAIAEVYYPSIYENDGLQEILKPGAGHGPLLSFTLKDPSTAPHVYDHLRVCKGPSLGTDFTLLCPYTLLAHYQELPWAESCGVARNLLRVSTGLEETADLLERFRMALG